MANGAQQRRRSIGKDVARTMNDPSEKPALLIVDDERNFAESLQLAIDDQYAVSIAGSLASARSELGRSNPVAVLLDLRLPDGDGLDLLRELSRGVDPPVVVVMTAFATHDTYLRSMGLGAADYLSKPLDVRLLRNVLSRHLTS